MHLNDRDQGAGTSKDGSETTADRIERLRALRKSMADSSGPARSLDDVEQGFRARLKDTAIAPEARVHEDEAVEGDIASAQSDPVSAPAEPVETIAAPCDLGPPEEGPETPAAYAEPAQEPLAAPVPTPEEDQVAEPGPVSRAAVQSAFVASSKISDLKSRAPAAPSAGTADMVGSSLPPSAEIAAEVGDVEVQPYAQPASNDPIVHATEPNAEVPVENEAPVDDVQAGNREHPSEFETKPATGDYAGPVSAPRIDDPDDLAAVRNSDRKPGGRAKKTRLLGFDHSEDSTNLFATAAVGATPETSVKYPVGWLVVCDGPGLGQSFALTGGAAQIGRGENQGIRLDFGDTSISRENHAAVAYDTQANSFLLAQGGKANLVRLNGRPVLSNEPLSHGDELRIGETTLRFVALCDSSFRWPDEKEGGTS